MPFYCFHSCSMMRKSSSLPILSSLPSTPVHPQPTPPPSPPDSARFQFLPLLEPLLFQAHHPSANRDSQVVSNNPHRQNITHRLRNILFLCLVAALGAVLLFFEFLFEAIRRVLNQRSSSGHILHSFINDTKQP